MQPSPSAETSRCCPRCALVHPVLLVGSSFLELDQELDRLALVHRAVALGHLVERAGAVEDAAGLDPALEDVRQQLLDVGARRGRAAADRDVVEERLSASSGSARAAARRRGRRRRRRGRCRAPSASTGRGRRTRGRSGRRGRRSARGRARSPRRRARSTMSVAPKSAPSAIRSGWRPSRMICSAPSRLAAITPQSPTAPSPTTATVLSGRDARGERGVVAGAHHVGEREERRHQRVVLADRERDERAVGLRDAHRLALAAVDVVAAPAAAVQAGGLQTLLAEDAGAVGPGERRDDDVAGLDGADVRRRWPRRRR